jgi:hypothetical protein
MRWFKHFSSANTDDKLVSVRARFGLWGVGCYWIFVELVCAQMKPQNPKAEALFRLSELAASFGCKRKKLKTFLEHLRNIRGINYSLEGDLLKIEIPRLLKSLDNYHSNLQVSSKPSLSVSTSGLMLERGTLLSDIQKQYEVEKVF